MTPHWTPASLAYWAQFAAPPTFTPCASCGCLVRIVRGEARMPICEDLHLCGKSCSCRAEAPDAHH